MSEVTHILDRAQQSDPQAAAELLPVIYEELRKPMAMRTAKEPRGQTLQTTALVNEDWPRVTGNAEQDRNNRGTSSSPPRRPRCGHGHPVRDLAGH